MRKLSILSVCSGIEAASVAFSPLGGEVVGVCEIEPNPCKILHARVGAGRPRAMPDPDEDGLDADSVRARRAAIRAVSSIPAEGRIPNYGDFTTLIENPPQGIDMLVGGTPCQAFSIAGKRLSLQDARGNLTLAFAMLADALGVHVPIFWENVPGVLSAPGNPLGCFLGMLAGSDAPLATPTGKWTTAGYVCGPKRAVGWVIRDAQFFGLAQRRRRLFVFAGPPDRAQDVCDVLFQKEGTRVDIRPERRRA